LLDVTKPIKHRGLKSHILSGIRVFSVITPCYEKKKVRQEPRSLSRGKGGKVFFAKYKKVIIDPVTIWQMPDAQRPEGSPLRDIPIEDLQNLAFVFRDAMVKELEQDYEIVQHLDLMCFDSARPSQRLQTLLLC
jgi:hypothetical protein